MGSEVNFVSVLVRGTAAAGTVVGGGVAQQTHANDHIARKDTETEKHNLLPSVLPVKRSRCDIPFTDARELNHYAVLQSLLAFISL